MTHVNEPKFKKKNTRLIKARGSLFPFENEITTTIILQISVEDCQQALTETKWIVPMAIKYVKLKQLLSAQLGDITLCKEALMACDWDVQRAANHVLSNLSSPEIIDV